MSQGKKYDKEKIVESLKPYFKLGYSVPDACEFVGIDNSTVYKWIKEDDTLSKNIKGWRNEISVIARSNWRDRIKDKKDYEASRDWLAKKDRKEFGNNLDVTSGGEGLKVTEVKWVIEDGSKKEE